MAIVRLGQHEASAGQLPPVCMRCGTFAHTFRQRFFFHCPWWVYLGIPLGGIPFLVLAWWRGQAMRVLAPLCATHQNEWRWQRLAVLLVSLAVTLGLGVASLVLLFQENAAAVKTGKYNAWHQDNLFYLGCGGLLAGPALYLAAGVLLHYLGIHATAIDQHSITLTGVAPEFVEAVRVAHEEGVVATEPEASAKPLR
jgi:hypothetical protein